MSFFGFMSSPVSIPPVFDTTPCLEHLMEYEDCVIEYVFKVLTFSVGSEKKQYFMPTWPTLWPGLMEGKSNETIDTRVFLITLTLNSLKICSLLIFQLPS